MSKDTIQVLHADRECSVTFDPKYGILVLRSAGAAIVRECDLEAAQAVARAAKRGAFLASVSVADAELLARSPDELN